MVSLLKHLTNSLYEWVFNNIQVELKSNKRGYVKRWFHFTQALDQFAWWVVFNIIQVELKSNKRGM